MSKKANYPVRNAANEKHMFLWQVAMLMGISYSGFMQKMRSEWPEDEQQRVIKLIEDYAGGETHDGSEGN